MVPSSNPGIYNTTHTHKAQGTSWKRRQEECENQKNRKSAVRVDLLETSGKLHPCSLNMAAQARPEIVH